MDQIIKCGLCKNDFSLKQNQCYICFRCVQRVCSSCYVHDPHNLCTPCYISKLYDKEPIKENKLKTFQLYRKHDISGVSGTGLIAEGCEFTFGRVCVCWLGSQKSIVLWDSIEDLKKVNCHNGSTVIKYLD